jgi:dGTPase
MPKYYVIQDSSLAAQQRGQRKVIRELFTTIYNAALPEDSDEVETIQIIPPRYLEQAKRVREQGSKMKRVRFVADFITGLTERQATQLHKRLTGDTPGTLQDRILR